MAKRTAVSAALAAALAVAAAGDARAFCGFYVNGAGAKLYNNATIVVMMREGMRTVLSMQNNYQGPTEDFAMVVPVPVVLHEDNVKTLPREIFEHVDTLAAPRLVEYWERDPCWEPPKEEEGDWLDRAAKGGAEPPMPSGGEGHGVTIEAKFTVGEYEIVILSAKDALGLDTWLREQKYKIPEGAEPILRPYVEAGSKFFVAKVDVKKVKFEGGMAMLSPLRFHYDTPDFTLPVRLGLMNSAGTQDLLVHILARGTRYEVANYPNVTIPTNLDVAETARDSFGAFYAALFDETLKRNPRAVVTEYAWSASSCDPCPTPSLDPSEVATLGADVLFTPAEPVPPSGAAPAAAGPAPGAAPAAPAGSPPAVAPAMKMATPPPPPSPPSPTAPVPPSWAMAGEFVLTRLHARYTKDALGEDLVFRAAPPITGGREWLVDGDKLEKGARPAGPGETSNFQARYAIRHAWTGPIACEHPRRGVWEGPPPGLDRPTGPTAARDLAFAPRGGVALASYVREGVPELGLAAGAAPAPSGWSGGESGGRDERVGTKGCLACAVGVVPPPGGCAAAASGGGLLAALALPAVALGLRRRRR
jgi:hypothetical protein